MQSKRKRMRTLVLWSVIHILSSVYLFSYTLLILLCSCLQFCAATATDSIPTGGSISSIQNQTLISAGEIFELGFFSLPHDGPRRSRYVGIWYYKSLPTVVVWVANRDNPLPHQAAGNLSIRDGDLILSDGSGRSYFSTSLGPSANSNRTVTLLDSGNLVFSDGGSGNKLWQSFDYPTDTFLPGMKMDANLNLTSWTSHDDPRSGNFSFKRDERDDRITWIWFRSNQHWRSGELGKFISYSEIYSGVERLLANFSNNNKVGRSRSTSGASVKKGYISFPYNSTFSSVSDYNYTRLVMNSSGEIQFWNISSSNIRDDKKKEWNLIWSAPGDNCSVYNFCGKFGSCNSKNRLVCKCLPGFKPNSPEDWGSGEFSAGCSRKSEIITNKDTFVSLKMMKVEQPDLEFLKAEREKDCREECLRNKGCQAYSYVKPRFSRINPNTCWLRTSDLGNLEEEYITHDPDLYVRVAASDIGSTSRSCETCGTNMIPYPLSTASNCGDPMYFSFNCNTITGRVSFQTLNGKYRVSSINTETHTFVIQVKDVDCKNSGGKVLALEHLSPPFHVTNSCYIDVGTPSSNFSQKVSNKVEIRWDPPPEPVCASSAECTDWPNSSCKAREDKKKRCLCNESYSWDGMNLNCTQGVRNPKNMQTRTAVIIMAAITVVSLLCSVSYFSYRRGLDRKRRESRERMPGSQAIHMYDTERRVKNFIDSAEFNEDDKKDIDVPFFDLESILAATEYFSEANKLGQGGFGPVYKGKFAGEQEIAVKRLSSHSGQGLEEFKNEVVLIAKLQHRNLVRLLGYCVKGEEKILLYEYMPNKSLDYFIFDRTLCMLLDWNKRFDIILGIARGLLYLHQDSRLRIIHRDLKTGNILLDNEMNPKISDFGLARIVGGKETEANTNTVVGTYGYMSPEYALDGLFSIKSDVFSFGVILLEIVSGKRNTGFYRSRQAFNLLGYAWGLWKEEKALDLMDQALLESCNIGEVLKCIIVGLLCVQEDPSDRPNMSNAVFMLGSETTTLPNPKQPAFVEKKWMSTTPSSSSSKPETHSNFELTISDVEG